jgi:imidazolonepropionase-like amidohydrolase
MILCTKFHGFLRGDPPNVSLFAGDSYDRNILAEVRELSQAEGKILFAADAGFRTDCDPTSEYVEMARAGMSFPEILASLTTAPAARFGDSGGRGKSKPARMPIWLCWPEIRNKTSII